tara:strand:+ start:1665 stop:2141 length:477 start_codon:yes stop_codon:yes gene_type:complete
LKRYEALAGIVYNSKKITLKACLIFLVSASTVAKAENDCAIHEGNEYSELFNLTRITSTYTGAAGIKPPHVVAYECLMESDSRDYYLHELVREADVGGQLYAMAGLKALGASEFEQEMVRFEGSDREIRATIGCVGRRITVGKAMDWIKDDQWPESKD